LEPGRNRANRANDAETQQEPEQRETEQGNRTQQNKQEQNMRTETEQEQEQKQSRAGGTHLLVIWEAVICPKVLTLSIQMFITDINTKRLKNRVNNEGLTSDSGAGGLWHFEGQSKAMQPIDKEDKKHD
jgi:hypothetical protein